MSGSSIIHVQISIANITTGVTSNVGVTGHEDDDKSYYILYLCHQGINKIKCTKNGNVRLKTHRLFAQDIQRRKNFARFCVRHAAGLKSCIIVAR